ncbi:MAG: FAD-binding oxidoreductase [Chloroflexi bacterium]|nr:FAD-binding oxidoreductase [Chloroflexota bacterium]
MSAILQLANAHCVPVTPWGVGTSLEGNPVPLYGGISLSTERMNRLIAVHADDFQVTVQPGLPLQRFEPATGPHGLFSA